MRSVGTSRVRGRCGADGMTRDLKVSGVAVSRIGAGTFAEDRGSCPSEGRCEALKAGRILLSFRRIVRPVTSDAMFSSLEEAGRRNCRMGM